MVSIEEWKGRPSAELPLEIVGALANPHITLVPEGKAGALAKDSALAQETGYRLDDDGVWQVAISSSLPGVTPDMLRWLFWWCPKADERFCALYPESHETILFRESDRSYFERAERPHFRDNMVYVTERVGREGTASAIRFVKPEECALDPKKLHQEGVPYALCAEIGTNHGAMMHTRFIGLFHKTDVGLHFTGRFWVGSMLPWKWMRKRMHSEEGARALCEHASIEARNLAERLPSLYEAYGPGDERYRQEPEPKKQKKHRKR